MVAHGACHTTRKKLPPLELERRWQLSGPQSMMMRRKVTEPQEQPLKGGCQDQGTEDQQPGLVRREPGLLRRNNMDVEASMELARHLDETGLHHVYTVCTCHPN